MNYKPQQSPSSEVWKLAPVAEQYLSIREGIPFVQEQIGMMLTILSWQDGKVNNFLDLGCGDGVLGAAILGRFPKSRGMLADFSEPMLDQARAGLKDYASQLEFLNVDYADPNWVKLVQHAALFDAIVSGYSIHHQPDVRKKLIYAEIYSLLKPGGWFVNVEHIAPGTQLVTEMFESYIVEARVAKEVRSGGTQTRQQITEAFNSRQDKAVNILAPTEVQLNWLRELGYQDVDCYFRAYTLAVLAGRRPNS